MASRLLLSLLMSAPLLVPIAIFLNYEDASPVIDNEDGMTLLQVASPVVMVNSDAKLHLPSLAGVNFKAALAEYLAMTLFVILGPGSAMGIAKEQGYAWVLQVAFTFGIAITVLAYSIGHISGGHINCAVTFGLVLAGECSIIQGIANLVFQLLGSVTGAIILSVVYPPEMDKTGSLGSNAVDGQFTPVGALVGEILMTFLLMFTVLETAVNADTKANASMAPIAIGFAVFLAHSVLIPIDGCSINPTRSFGPALVSTAMRKNADWGKSFKDMWIFWLGPLAGAALAVGAYSGLK